MMKGQINHNPNYVLEAMELLYRYVNEDDYYSLKTKLMNKYSLTRDAERKLDMVIQLSDYVYKNIDTPKEKLDFYFHKLNENGMFFAKIIIWSGSTLEKDQLSDILLTMKELDKKDIYDRIVGYLVESNLINEANISDSDKINTVEDYMSLIDTIDIAIQDKWSLSQICIRYSDHLEEMGVIIEKVILLLKEQNSIIEEIMKDFSDYWSNFLNNNDIGQYLNTTLNINVSDLTDHVIIRPFIAGCNNISCTMAYDEKGIITPGGRLYMMSGILFNEDFNMNVIRFNKEQINSFLKLFSDKSKLDIMLYIKDKKAYGQEIAKELNLTTPTISHHMNALHSAGFVNYERDSNRVYYSLNKETIVAFFDFVKYMLTD